MAKVIKAGKQLLSQGKIETEARFLDMRPVGAAIVPCHNLKEKSALLRSLRMPISDLINLCYNQAKSIGIN